MAFDLNKAMMKIMAERPTISVDQARILAKELEPTSSQAGDAWRDTMGIFGDVASLMSPTVAGGQIRSRIADAIAPLKKQETASARDARINNELLARVPGGSGPEEYNLVPQINVPPGSTVSELSAVDIDALMKKYYPDARPVATGAVTAPVGASTTTTPGNKTDYAKILMDRTTARDTREVPNLESPNALNDLQMRFNNLKYPTRPGLSDLSDDDKSSALLRMGLGMMGGTSPFFAQNFATGGTAGLNDAEKSRDAMMKDLVTKYGIDAQQAAALATAYGSDLAGRNVNATSKYNMGTQNLAAGDAAIGNAGTVANAADLARLKAISDASDDRYKTEVLKRYARVDADAATKALEERRAKDPGYQFLRQQQLANQFKDAPVAAEFKRFQDSITKGATREKQIDSFEKMYAIVGKESPDSPLAKSLMLIINNFDRYTPEERQQALDAGFKAMAKK